MSDSLSISPEESDWDWYYSQALWTAFAVIALAWVVIGGVAFWLGYSSVVCWGGRPTQNEIVMCQRFYEVPAGAAGYMYISFAWLLFVWHKLNGLERNWSLTAPDTFDRLRKRIAGMAREHLSNRVVFAFEMVGWATATLFAILGFYFLEISYPLGLLVIAALVRLCVAIYLGLTRGFTPRGRTPGPTGRSEGPRSGGPAAPGPLAEA
jgi:hypothetical protein